MLEFRSKPKDAIDFTVDDEAFRINPVAAFAFLDLSQMAVDEDKVYASPEEKVKAQAAQSVILRDIFRDHMEPAEWERFDKFCRGPNAPDLLFLVEILNGIVEASAARPTLPPSFSEPGRSDTGTSSTESAPSPASTSEPSDSTEPSTSSTPSSVETPAP